MILLDIKMQLRMNWMMLLCMQSPLFLMSLFVHFVTCCGLHLKAEMNP